MLQPFATTTGIRLWSEDYSYEFYLLWNHYLELKDQRDYNNPWYNLGTYAGFVDTASPPYWVRAYVQWQ